MWLIDLFLPKTMPSQIPLSSFFTSSYPETSVHTIASFEYICRFIQVLLLCTCLYLVSGKTFWTQKTQVISLCKHQWNCLKGWQHLNIGGVFLVNHYVFKKKKSGCAWQYLPQMYSNLFILKWILKLQFEISVPLFEKESTWCTDK